MTQLRVELNRLVKRYLDDPVDADALDRWVLERLQAILDSGDARAITLANAVDGGLVQIQEGAITKIELYEELRALVDRRPIFHIAEMEILNGSALGDPIDWMMRNIVSAFAASVGYSLPSGPVIFSCPIFSDN